jgi:hypothetical protein
MLRAIALGAALIITTAAVRAQEIRSAIGPLEKAARPSSNQNPVPRQTTFVMAASCGFS